MISEVDAGFITARQGTNLPSRCSFRVYITLLFLSSLILGFGTSAAVAQLDPVVHEQRIGPFRVIAPAGTARSATTQNVIRAAQLDVPLPGLPRDALSRASITISLAARVRDGLDAWTTEDNGLIVLRQADAEAWSEVKLRRVVRHELAHIGLARALAFAKLPPWLSEGYSEWAAGGVSCEGEVRLHLHFRLAAGGNGAEPFGEFTDPRLAYDAYSSFFEYLDTVWKASISDGRFVANLRSHGFDRGMVRTFGVDLPELERQWRKYASRRYANILNSASRTCGEHPDRR